MTAASLKFILHIYLSDIHVMQIFNVDAGTSKTGEDEVFPLTSILQMQAISDKSFFPSL